MFSRECLSRRALGRVTSNLNLVRADRASRVTALQVAGSKPTIRELRFLDVPPLPMVMAAAVKFSSAPIKMRRPLQIHVRPAQSESFLFACSGKSEQT